MANSDYEKRGAGVITPSATLSVTITARDKVLNVKNYFANDGTLPAAGQGIMLNGEIMRIVSVDLPKITVDRGCADTIPALEHTYGSTIWFITTAIGGDAREYMASETIGVKVLMKSGSGAMDVQNAPPNVLQFSHRFARPYPPGLVKVNSEPFYARTVITADEPNLAITWAHRDRITQGDTLQGHEQGSIGPEQGTTYTLRLFDRAGNLVRTVAGIVGNSYTYTLLDALVDLHLVAGVDDAVPGYFTLESERDGYGSWQRYRIDFQANGEGLPAGWGAAWGYAWGN